MPEYAYRAVDDSGKSVSGMMTAHDMDALESSLKDIGYWLVDAKEGREYAAVAGKGIFQKKVKRRDLINFFIQARSLIAAGVTLLDALKAMAEETEHPKFKAVLEDIARNVEGGNTLYESMEIHSDVFSEQILNMVLAGEQSGTLPDTFQKIHKYLDWMDKLVADIQQATTYPLIVLGMLFLFITVLFTFVVPKFIELLVSLKISLPLPTLIVMNVSGFFKATWWLWIVLIVFGLPVVKLARSRSARFAYAYDNMKMKLPVFGDLNRMFTMLRFSQTFSTLFSAGIPVLHNLKLCEGTVGNKVLEKAISETGSEVEEGVTMTDSFRKHDVFPPMVLRMVSVGEKTGNIGDALDNVSTYYNEEIPRRLKRLFAFFEPAMIIFLVSVVGFTALAIFLPILSLMGGIK